MKKILAFLLAATLLCAMFVLPSAAADNVNFAEEFDFAKKAPSIDGTVKTGEYGVTPIHTYSESKSQFVSDLDDYKNWDFSFYGVWDENYVYMAWVVKSEIHAGMPEIDHNNDGSYNEADSAYMWPYSCVQFIFTPGVPETGSGKFQTSEWSGDYLEVGLCLTSEGNQVRAAWSKPNNATALNVNDWDAVITRSGNTTTYEVRIPWSKSGLKEAGNGAKFGLTYAVAAQEDYNTKKGMIEWQDAILGSKMADNAAVITLTGNEDVKIEDIPDVITPVEDEKEAGEVPEAAKDKVQILLNGVDKSISTDMAYLYTNPSTVSANNNSWATGILLAPVEGEDGYYTVVENKTGDGTGAWNFDSEVKEGYIALCAHTAGTEGSDSLARVNAVKALEVGAKIGVFGVDFEKKDTQYSNAMLFVVDSEAAGDESSEVESSEVESSEVESSKVESSKVVSSSVATSSEVEEDGGLGVWLWVIIFVVVAAVAAGVVIVLKKKKA